MSNNTFMYLLIALIIAVTLTTASTIQKSPCTSDECRIAEDLGLLFPQELAESQRLGGYPDRPAAYKFKRDYDFVRFGRSAPSKKASYDYIRFGRK